MPKRILEGVVVSDKGDKTVVVKVERTFLHPLLKKTVRRSKKYHAHDETNANAAGETARIVGIIAIVASVAGIVLQILFSTLIGSEMEGLFMLFPLR